MARHRAPSGFGRFPRGPRAGGIALLAVLALAALLGAVNPASAGSSARILVSAQPDRGSAYQLNGAYLRGLAYVFLRPGRAAVDRVVFSLDPGTPLARQVVDDAAPFDFGGTRPDGTAGPLDAAMLAPGTHRMTAVMRSGGHTRVLTATFMTRPASTPTPPAPTTTTAPPSSPAPPTTTTVAPPTTTTNPGGGGAPPSAPPAALCGDTALLAGPALPPAGAIIVAAGDNATVDFSQAGRTYWFAPGVHTLGRGEYDQVVPGDNSRYVGAPGAVIDGRGVNRYAFTQHATGVTIEFLTIQNFGGPMSNNNEGVVNHDGASGWTIHHNTIQRNGGAGVFIGSNNAVHHNCLRENGQYGFSMWKPTHGALSNITLDHNEIAGNNTDDWESKIEGCGCTGGGKFWDAHTVRVTNNYVHHNRSVGLWADTNNYDFLFEGNWIEGNDSEAIFYEISYNAAIRNNVIKGNAVVSGAEFAARGDGFPAASVYISESGGDARLPFTLVGSPTIDIRGNLFVDNWGGITVWENADRYCNSPANTSTDYCTIINPNATSKTCASGTIANQPYYSDCRWKSQNVTITGNDFRIAPANVRNCDTRYCGHMAILSNWGTYPSWSPYQRDVVQKAITFDQGNRWRDNKYTGPWRFVVRDAATLVDVATWRAAPYNQDVASTFIG